MEGHQYMRLQKRKDDATTFAILAPWLARQLKSAMATGAELRKRNYDLRVLLSRECIAPMDSPKTNDAPPTDEETSVITETELEDHADDQPAEQETTTEPEPAKPQAENRPARIRRTRW